MIQSACIRGVPQSCDDGIDCTLEGCLPERDACVQIPRHDQCAADEICEPLVGCARVPCHADADCDDGLFCDGAETCDTAAGRCVRGAPTWKASSV